MTRMRTCPACGVAVELRGQRMASHACTAGAAPAPRRSGTSRAQLKVHKEVIAAAGGACFYCGGEADRADHVVPWVDSGTDDASNLVACCRRCNRVKADVHLRPRPTIALVGEIGAGKSTLAALLSERTGWPVLAIDSYRARRAGWDELVADLALEGPAIVESVAVPSHYRLELIRRCALVVLVECAEPVRLQRLRPGAPRDRFLRRDESAHCRVDGAAPVRSVELARLETAALARGIGPNLRPAARPEGGPLRLV